MLAVMSKKLSVLRVEVRNKISWIDFAHISNCFLKRNDSVLNKARLVQENKLLNLGMRAAHDGNDPEKVIFNYSSRVLTPNEKMLLAKGLNLSIPPKKLNYGDTLAPFKLLYRDVLKSEPAFSNHMKKPLEASLRNTAFDCLNNFDPKLEQNLPPTEVEALNLVMKDSCYSEK